MSKHSTKYNHKKKNMKQSKKNIKIQKKCTQGEKMEPK